MSVVSSQTALGYVRVSDRTDPNAPSLDTQEAALRAWSTEQGVQLLSVYRESHTGVELHERPQLQALLSELGRRPVDLVVFYALDRFSRDPVHQMWLRVTVAAAGARLECVTEPLPEGDAGVLLQFVGGWASKREWSQIRERTMRGKRDRVERGKVPGAGPDLYGWRKDRELGVRVIHEPEAAVAREIFEWAASGVPIREIARRLTERGTPSPGRGKYARDLSASRWSTSQLQRMLRNPAYAGQGYAWTHVLDKARGVTVQRDRSEWVPLPDGVVPAIVEPAVWEQVQRRLDTNHGEWTRSHANNREYLLRGFAWCGICGRRLYTDLMRDGERVYRYYRCSSRRWPEGPCGLPHIPCEPVEADVWQRVRAFILDPHLIDDERQRMMREPSAGLEAAIAAAEARIRTIVAGQQKLLSSYRQSSSLPWELVEREIAAAEAERKAEERQLEELRARQAERERVIVGLDELAGWCDTVAENLDQLSFLERREVLDLLGVRVMVHGRDEWELEPAFLRLGL